MLQRETRHFAAYRIKAGDRDQIRRIINVQFHTGCLFEAADVASFPTDDPSFHFLAWNCHDRNRSLLCFLLCHSFNSECNNVLCFFGCGRFRFFFFIFDIGDRFMLHFLFHFSEQFFLCVLARHFCHAFQNDDLLIDLFLKLFLFFI